MAAGLAGITRHFNRRTMAITAHPSMRVERGPGTDKQLTAVLVPLRADQPRSSIDHRLVVRVFGHPQVENSVGVVAEFRKKKALELVTWLSLNSDRQRRSTARTAMWESNVSDSTFATIVSDMRRGLSGISESSPRDLVPPTYSDVMEISSEIVSEADLLAQAYQAFVVDRNAAHRLADMLKRVRDIPFAGVSYEWADLDGTTTRLVMLVTSACVELASFAIDAGDMLLLHIACTAGLRVMPGNEELLALQRRLTPLKQ